MRKGDETRQEIIRKAAPIFNRKGYRGAALSDLMRATGLKKGGLPARSRCRIIEPGGFLADFAGSSTQLSEGWPEYDSTVGAAVFFQKTYNGTQAGGSGEGCGGASIRRRALRAAVTAVARK